MKDSVLKDQRRMVLSKRDFARWVECVQRKAPVFAPQRTPSGEHLVLPLAEPADLMFDYVNSVEPLKAFFFPQVEPMFRYRRENGRYHLEAAWEREQRVLVGVRSCDVSALKMLDAALLPPPEDSYYRAQREQTTIVSLACLRGGKNCFCICTDSGPFLTEGYDVQLADLGDRYLVEVGSEKGEALVQGCDEWLKQATREDVKARVEAEAKARDAFQLTHCYMAAAMRRLTRNEVEPEVWRELGPLCVECGGCTYACPCCYCFNVVDLPEESGGTRLRFWDHCILAGYAREASGHNPREERGERLRHRLFHKISRQYFVKLGALGCVGCGRCVAACPTGANMPMLVEAVRKGVE